MKYNLAFKHRIYLNSTQANIINKNFSLGLCIIYSRQSLPTELGNHSNYIPRSYFKIVYIDLIESISDRLSIC